MMAVEDITSAETSLTEANQIGGGTCGGSLRFTGNLSDTKAMSVMDSVPILPAA